MKNLVTKNNVLFLSFIGTIIFFSPVFFYGIFDCYNKEQFLCTRTYQSITLIFVSFVPLFLFSLITYRMRPQAFDQWMKFAIWATPALIFLTFLINGGGGNNGFGTEGVIGAGFDVMLYMILYGLYCGISIWRIIRA